MSTQEQKKRLEIPERWDVPFHHQDDVARIVAVCAAAGYEVSPVAADFAWTEFSDTYAASWLGMNGFRDEELVSIARTFLVERDA